MQTMLLRTLIVHQTLERKIMQRKFINCLEISVAPVSVILALNSTI